jgi:hypothetical protein
LQYVNYQEVFLLWIWGSKGTTSEREESHSFEKTAVVGVLNKEVAQLVFSETTQPIKEADQLSHFQRFYPLSLE